MASRVDLFLDLWRAAHRAERVVARELAADGTDGPQFALLLLLQRLGPSTTTALAAELGVPFMTMSDALDRLARSGDVESAPNPADRRSSVFSLTAAGLERCRASRPALERALTALERANGGRVDGLHEAVVELDEALRRVEP